ncbi:MAG: hypothetical protein P8076_04850 [Gammaproteobacteria bacterium]
MFRLLKHPLSFALVLLTALTACGTASAGRVYSGVGFHSYYPYHRHYGYPYGGVHYGVGYYGRGDDTAAAVVIGMLLGAALAQSTRADYGQAYYPPYAYAPPPGYAYPPRVPAPVRVRIIRRTLTPRRRVTLIRRACRHRCACGGCRQAARRGPAPVARCVNTGLR